MMSNRRGDEFVEAAMVLPVLLLTILSLIMLMIYYYSCLQAQTQMHGQMLEEMLRSEAVFDIIKNKTETSSKMGGITGIILNRNLEGRLYVISEADIIRAGGLLALT
ncbi:MAG: hypothetical protein ACI4LA_06825 [Emergencia sp.]